MTKILVLAVLVGIACRMLTGRWPWALWSESQNSQDRAQARALLGVSRFASREDILAAHRQAIKNAHPDRGGTNDAVHRIDAARDLLLEQTPARK